MILVVALTSCLFLSPMSKFFVGAQAAGTTGSSSKTTTTSTTASDKKQQQSSSSSSTLSVNVIELTSKNFASNIGDGNVWLIEFYTDWCKHCQNFKHVYDNIGRTFHSSPNEKIRVAKVDATVEKALTTRFGVTGFPSFFLVSGWDAYEFDGVRTEANLITFARGGYKKQDPIPFLMSPMGPMGVLQGALIHVGIKFMDFFATLQEAYGISPVLAGMALCMLAVFGGMFSIVLLTVLSTPREKND